MSRNAHRAAPEPLAQELERLPDRVDLQTKPLPAKAKGKKLHEPLRLGLYLKLGVDLTAVESLGLKVALVVLSEVGPDLSRFPTEKHFSSWLGLCPDHRISGGRILSNNTHKVANRLSDALRLSATSLEHSRSALGAYYRRMKAHLGAPEGITATAHKLARIVYRMLTKGEAYVSKGLAEYGAKFKKGKRKSLKRAAQALGLQLVEAPQAVHAVS